MREIKWFSDISHVGKGIEAPLTTIAQPTVHFSASLAMPWHRTVLQSEIEALIARILREFGPPTFEARFLRRCHRRLLELPIGLLTQNFKATYGEEVAALRRTLADMKRSSVDVPANRRPVTIFGQSYFLRHELLVALLARFPDDLMLRAWTCFAFSININPTVLRPEKYQRRAVPATQRRRNPTTGRMARGPDWTEQDDAVLIRWFGKRIDTGKRRMPTESEWTTILRELHGMRTRASVLSRISILNCKLKRKLMIEGYLTSDGLKRYMDQKLGTRTHLPKYRPTVDGKHYITPHGVVAIPEKDQPKDDWVPHDEPDPSLD
jgi:hypothetical protein